MRVNAYYLSTTSKALRQSVGGLPLSKGVFTKKPFDSWVDNYTFQKPNPILEGKISGAVVRIIK